MQEGFEFYLWQRGHVALLTKDSLYCLWEKDVRAVHTKFRLRFWLKLSSDPSLATLFLQSPFFRGVKFYIPVTLVWFLQAPLLYCLLIPSFQGYGRNFTDSLLTIPVARWTRCALSTLHFFRFSSKKIMRGFP